MNYFIVIECVEKGKKARILNAFVKKQNYKFAKESIEKEF